MTPTIQIIATGFCLLIIAFIGLFWTINEGMNDETREADG